MSDFNFNLDPFPSFLPRILYPVWWVVWFVALAVYLVFWMIGRVFVLIRWCFTPSRAKKEAEARDRKKEKEAKRLEKTRH